jgi:site-specific recombinase XerD
MEKLSPLFAIVRDFFKVYLPNEQKSSPHTIRAYQKSLELLFDFVKTQKGVSLSSLTFEMIDRAMLSAFLDHLEVERGCSVSTRNHRLNSIRAFYNYASETDITTVIYLKEIQKVSMAKAPERLVEHMSEAAVVAVLAQPDTSTRKGLRDMFLMLLLYKTGARIQELLDIRLCDIQFGKIPKITLHGKGAKPRSVPLRDSSVRHLSAYIEVFHFEEEPHSDHHLFYVFRNGIKKRMTEDNARNLVHRHGVKARMICSEVPERVYPHLFRHSCAMHMYQSGVHLTLISQWLGHADLETTLIYAHADTELKRQAIEKAIPDDSPLKEHIDAERYKIDDEEILKQLCGMK